MIPWAVAHQSALSMGFHRQEYWSGLPFPTPGDLHDPGILPSSLVSPALADRFFSTEPPGKPPSYWIIKSVKINEKLLMHVHACPVSWSCSTLCEPPWTAAYQASLSLTRFWSLPQFTSYCSNSCLNSYYPTISSSAVPFSSCPQSFLASGSFPMNQLFTSGGQSIGVSALVSVLIMNIQD